MNQIILTAETIPQYLADRTDLPFRVNEIRSVEELAEGNCNFTFVITLADGTRYFLQQAQPADRRSIRLGAPRPMPVERMDVEVDMIRRLQTLWGGQIVPHLYFYDHENRVMLENDMATGRQPLSDAFANSQFYPESGTEFGRLLGKLHTSTWGSKTEDSDHGGLDGFARSWFFNEHLGAGIRHHLPAQQTDLFYAEAAAAQWCLIWADPIARNIFIGDRGNLGLIDFNYSVAYDPALDGGLLLAQWVWQGLNPQRPELEQVAKDFQDNFWTAYRQEYKEAGLTLQLPDVERRAAQWLGVYLISRVDGASGSYVADPAWAERLRTTGIELFTHDKNTTNGSK